MHSAAILAGGQATRFGGRDKSALLVDGRTILDRQIAALAPLTADLLIVGGHRSDMVQPFHPSTSSGCPEPVEGHGRIRGAAALAPPALRRAWLPLDRPGRQRRPEPPPPGDGGPLTHREGGSPAPQPIDRGPDKAAPRFVSDIVAGCGPLGGLHAALTEALGDALFLVACDMPYVSSRFIAYLLSLAGGADIVVPQSDRGYHPLCAVYTRACLEPAAARLADRRLKMRELLAVMRTRVVPIEDIRRFGDPDRLLANVNTP
ncbi:MAG TPA: molybdenum cofactor guanylyltransferase, partial [Vicinamibacterales bacterium]|nr:molybdenum cofactor guanylyltransferase [Vicinamibacterales bacterium]